MVNIKICDANDSSCEENLDAFKAEQWPIVDKKHFGEKLPDFDRKKYTLIAKADNEIIGYIAMEIDMGVALVKSLLIHSKFQRQGIASSLLREAESKAIENGCHLLKTETGSMWDARKLYEKQDFVVVSQLDRHYGEVDFVLMEKRL